MARLQTYAAPTTNGQDGAPLIKTADSSEWVPALAPSSVVDGVITVDQTQPNNIYGIPGSMITGTGSNLTMTGGVAFAEHFYVASDLIVIDRIAFKLVSSTAGLIRMAIADDSDTLLTTAVITSPIDTVVNYREPFTDVCSADIIV